jgi:hypothetical protein
MWQCTCWELPGYNTKTERCPQKHGHWKCPKRNFFKVDRDHFSTVRILLSLRLTRITIKPAIIQTAIEANIRKTGMSEVVTKERIAKTKKQIIPPQATGIPAFEICWSEIDMVRQFL